MRTCCWCRGTDTIRPIEEAVKLIVRDLRVNRNEASMLASLTVSHALSRIALKLQTACDKCTGS